MSTLPTTLSVSVISGSKLDPSRLLGIELPPGVSVQLTDLGERIDVVVTEGTRVIVLMGQHGSHRALLHRGRGYVELQNLAASFLRQWLQLGPTLPPDGEPLSLTAMHAMDSRSVWVNL